MPKKATNSQQKNALQKECKGTSSKRQKKACIKQIAKEPLNSQKERDTSKLAPRNLAKQDTEVENQGRPLKFKSPYPDLVKNFYISIFHQ